MTSTADKFWKIVTSFPRKKIIVVGDLIADEYIQGMTSRISREAPVLILDFKSRKIVPGGGANTVNNIAALGGKVVPIGVIGDDEAGRELRESLKHKGVDMSGITTARGFNTVLKTRILAGRSDTTLQQVIRIDKTNKKLYGQELVNRLAQTVKSRAKGAGGLIVSDYHCGVIAPAVIKAVNEVISVGELVTAIDSRYGLRNFKKATVYTPNIEEAAAVIGEDNPAAVNIDVAGHKLIEFTGAESMLITRGRTGMALFEAGKPASHIPIFGSDEIADVTGAGDTVIASFTLALAAGASKPDAAKIATLCASIVVMKRGTATPDLKELKDIIYSKEGRKFLSGTKV
jgi:D-glycero-beta-D-manno-heptose-7-phosphate kinase